MSASLGVGVVLQQRVRRQQHAGRAVSALQAMLIPESLLERVQRAALREPFDRENLVAVGLHREHRARLHRLLAVHDDDAAAAARRVAADVRAGQPALFAQEVGEQRARLDVSLVADAIDLDVTFMPAPPDARAPDANRARPARQPDASCIRRCRAGRPAARCAAMRRRPRPRISSARRFLAGEQTLGLVHAHGARTGGRQRHARAADRAVGVQRHLHGGRGGGEVADLALDLLIRAGRAVVGHRKLRAPAPSRLLRRPS